MKFIKQLTKWQIVLISIVTLLLASAAFYFILGEKHVAVAFVGSILIMTKLKAIAMFSAVTAKTYLFLSASKGKIFFFIKNLTFVKGISLALKRFIIDNVISKWIEKNFTDHISGPIKEWFRYYNSLNLRTKIKKSLTFIVPTSILGGALYFGGMLESLAIYAQLKVIVIGFFKALWVIASKAITYVIAFISGTWLAPIVEILALSWLLSWIEKIPYVGKYISGFFNNISKGFGIIFSQISFYFHKYIGRHMNSRMTGIGIKFGSYLNNKINYIKVKNELSIFNEFEEKILYKDIQGYFKVKRKPLDKKSFYQLVNKTTNDHVDIKAFIEMDKSMEVIKDFFILEGLASCNETGSSHSRISKRAFWAMNLNDSAIMVFSKTDSFKPRFLSPLGLKLIQPKNDIEFEDVYVVDVDQNKFDLVERVPKPIVKKKKKKNEKDIETKEEKVS